MKTDLEHQLMALVREIESAAEKVADDRGASDALVAVVSELREKARRAATAGDTAGEWALHDVVLALEQAGDSARDAAFADGGITSGTREAVARAHDAAKALKDTLPEPAVSGAAERSPAQENL